MYVDCDVKSIWTTVAGQTLPSPLCRNVARSALQKKPTRLGSTSSKSNSSLRRCRWNAN